MKCFARKLIIFCLIRASKYEKLKDMLLKQENALKYVYSIGTVIIERDKWLSRAMTIQNLIKDND